MPTIFHSTSELLTTLLDSISSGKTQLPDFQRDWVWDDERIRRILASVLQSYPIGAIMLLQTGNPNVNFLPRPIEGVSLNGPVNPERLILDGQQRLTSLYQALCTGKPVATRDSRGNSVKRWYYLDIEKCIDPNSDKEEAVLSVPEDKLVRGMYNQVIADYSTREKECVAGVVPVHLIMNPQELFKWQADYLSDSQKLAERSVKWVKFTTIVQSAFTQYQVPVIMLLNTTPKDAVCQVFENVNTGGISLTVFELLTASFAADNFSLREDWQCRSVGSKCPATYTFNTYFEQDPILQGLGNTDFLQAVALLVTYQRKKANPSVAVSCKRKEILKLSLQDYRTWADKVTQGFFDAAKFLMEQKIFSRRDLPYATQLIPLAAIFVELGTQAHNQTVRQMIARWYWCGVFGELYGGAVETRFARDLPQVVDWIKGGSLPDTITEAYFDPNRLLSLRTRNSAAYKGVHVLLMREGCKDFLSGVSIDLQTYYNDSIDIHHIFPVEYCRSKGIPPEDYNSIINKTPLSSRTNGIIGGNAPSTYLNNLQNKYNIPAANLDQLLRTHVIDVNAIRSDDFNTFFQKRKDELYNKILMAMS
ncbi:MAG TPA: DUF262 domain-containing protein [Bacillota bacterium]|nr:DUF262 domain-containing protein [Peptococcaceae bacterium MAG4]HPZ43565.1 DUF262 domain-containing protein [Bacillota bacterium]HQD75965.1 DUF262 domain-containing protein [Bacillota bacterium]HUM58294.1 DUF262 domain-containing protein [Bacillota bacterium]